MTAGSLAGCFAGHAALEAMASARPGDNARTGSSRSKAWIDVLPPAQNTAAPLVPIQVQTNAVGAFRFEVKDRCRP